MKLRVACTLPVVISLPTNAAITVELAQPCTAHTSRTHGIRKPIGEVLKQMLCQECFIQLAVLQSLAPLRFLQFLPCQRLCRPVRTMNRARARTREMLRILRAICQPMRIYTTRWPDHNGSQVSCIYGLAGSAATGA